MTTNDTRKEVKGKSDYKTWQGLPYAGPAEIYDKNDPRSRLPVLKRSFIARVFDISDPEDRKVYEKLLEDINSGLAEMAGSRFEWTDKGCRLYIEASFRYYTSPFREEYYMPEYIKEHDNDS